jgi:hypothetical protein
MNSQAFAQAQVFRTIQHTLFGRSTLDQQLSELAQRVQRLEQEHAQMEACLGTERRAQIEAKAALRSMIAQTDVAARSAPVFGSAFEAFPSVMRRPPKRGHPGGLPRARQISRLDERWSDGRFMARDDWEQTEREIAEAEDMRYAADGFARAEKAQRPADGTFTVDP